MKSNLEALVREYGNVPAVGPDRCRKDVMAEIMELAAPALPDVPYSGLEQRFFQGLNTITRRAVLQVLGGHTDAFMEQVRNHSDERRLFKHLFKAVPAKPVEVKHSAACLSAGGGPSDDDCICGAHAAQLAAARPAFTKGDTLASGDDGMYQSGIHCPQDNHYRAIICYGASAQEADARRDQVLDALLAPSTSYAKHGYILEAADGHQTWLKGDPADGMGRYGKIIQLYRKDT